MSIFLIILEFLKSKHEQTNLTKSSAFIRRDGVLYYIRLGYSLDGDIPVSALNMILLGPMDAVTAARAMENRCKSDAVRELRKQPETFSNYLTAVLNAQKYGTPVPEFIAEYLPMLHAKPEKETIAAPIGKKASIQFDFVVK